MKLSDIFKIIHDPSREESFIEIDKIYTFLKDSGDDFQRKNFNRAIRINQGGAKYVNGKECATFQSLLKFICNHASQDGCRTVLKTIEKEIIHQDKSTRSSSFELYKLISKTKIYRNDLLFATLTINENEIPSLATEYKSHFTEQGWKNICWFEKDFSNLIEISDLSFEEILDKKYNRFQTLLSISECGKALRDSSLRQVRKTLNRVEHSQKYCEVRLKASQTHIASVLDSDIKLLSDLLFPNYLENITSFDVIPSAKRNVIWAVFFQNSNIETGFSDLCQRIFYSLKRKHNVYLEKALLLDRAIGDDFNSSDGTILRFALRDAVETGTIHSVLKTWTGDGLIDDTIDIQEGELCKRCFSLNEHYKPLEIKSFNIIQEWYLELPIEVQLLLEQFINIRSVKRSKDSKELSRSKLEKLYFVYDILLNIYNRNYIGIFQKNNANKLLIEHKNIGTVFDVTSTTGATPSLKYAEEKLKDEANSDLCYYNTYLKDYQLDYKSTSGETKEFSNLRNCHAILMLDNLVRLQYIADPDPGVHRSKQLCTLPITVQGLPIDSKITEEWHLPDCDGTFSCICKQPITLSDENVVNALVELRDEEREAHTNFFNWMTFGNHLIWKHLPDDLLEQMEENQESQIVSVLENMVTLENENTVDDDDNDCQDDDLVTVLETIRNHHGTDDVEQIFSDDDDEISELTNLEKSMDEMSILEQDMPTEAPNITQDCLESFGFIKFKVPPLLCKHPPPAVGRDDDVEKIREILDDFLVKMGYEANKEKFLNRILCGPDNKIGKCIFQLMDRDIKYKAYLPEFPLLHLRKSKINMLISAYKNAGLLEILQVMRNDEKNDWANLISIQHIDIATKHIRRLSLAFLLAFLIKFTHYLQKDDLPNFLSDMEVGDCASTSERWANHFSEFLEYGCAQNATFALHVDMMQHCLDVVATSFSERLGGETGYNLLLGAVKGSLLFSFVNGATSYAPYSARLLFSHYTAGHFHKCLKKVLYTTPFKNSKKNFATDTKREMDHLDVVKGFRSGSNIDSVTCRMSLIDSLNETSHLNKHNQVMDDDNLGMTLSETDLNHVYPAASLIMQRGGLSFEGSITPFNVYTKTPVKLPPEILDSASNVVGRYLLCRFLFQQRLLKTSVAPQTFIGGSQTLLNRAKRTKGITLKRIQKSKIVTLKTERQTKEETRLKAVAKQSKIIDALSSDNNACQALLKPDSSKPKVAKSLCIPRALKNLVASCSPTFPMEQYISLGLPYVPAHIKTSTYLCTIEFAGTKFKVGNIKSGNEYIQNVQRNLLGILKQSPVEKVVICEEKYSFTPDVFKASTREQRKGKNETDISHLKVSENVLSDTMYDNNFITKTIEGKKLISSYLAKNIEKLRIGRDIELIVDSEFISRKECECISTCTCQISYTLPIKCKFSVDGDPEVTLLQNVKQSKGEAEMAVGDWLVHLQNYLKPGQNATCYVTSGDIDAVCIHLYAVSAKMDRNGDGSFKNDIYVILQKPGGKVDVYHVTAILRLLEEKYQDREIGQKIAFSLCIGGNDFIPKMFGISHDTILKEIIGNTFFRHNLFTPDQSSITINRAVFSDLIKLLYTPKRHRGKQISYNDVRAITINKIEDGESNTGYKTSHPRKWLPPSTAIDRLGVLLQLQIHYMESVGIHNSVLPSFNESGVLVRNTSGEIEYDFGPDSHFDSMQDLPSIITNKKVAKRTLENTPQHGARRKRPLLTSTPRS